MLAIYYISFFKYICYCIYFVLMSVVLEKENKNLKEKKNNLKKFLTFQEMELKNMEEMELQS